MSNKNRIGAEPTVDVTTPQSAAEKITRDHSSRLPNLPQPWPPPPKLNNPPPAPGQNWATANMPEDVQTSVPQLPSGHLGGSVPQTPVQVQAAAAQAALPPGSPPDSFYAAPQLPTPAPMLPQAPPAPAVTQRAAAPPLPTPRSQPVPVAIEVTSPAAQNLVLMRRIEGEYYMVSVDDEANVAVETFEDDAALRDRIAEALDQKLNLLVFRGERLRVSDPIGKLGQRYLVTATGSREPIYRDPEPDDLTFDESGWVGKESKELAIATPVEAPAEVATAAAPARVVEDTPIFEGQAPAP